MRTPSRETSTANASNQGSVGQKYRHAVAEIVGAALFVGAFVLAGAGHAEADVPEVPVGAIDGVTAFRLGPFPNEGACLHIQGAQRANPGSMPSPRFATCYQADGGWFLLSRWAA